MATRGRSPSGEAGWPAADLIGRDDEVAVFDAALRRLANGVGGVAVVVGDGGIGKSTLLDTFGELAFRAGTTVLRASGDEDETDIGFGVIDQLVADAHKVVGSAWCRPADVLDPLAVGAELLGEWSVLAAERPVVVVVDDAGVADQPSLRAITFALRRLMNDPVLAVFASRPDRLGELPEGLVRLAGGHDNSVVSLDGLAGSAFATLLRDASPAALTVEQIERVREHTGGNPLHALALARELGPDLFAGNPLAPLPAPRSIAALVHARVAAFPPSTGLLLAAAAVLGTRARVATVGDVAGIADPAPLLAEAEAAGIVSIRPEVSGSVVRFDHPLTRSAIYHDLDPMTAAALHAAAARHVREPHDVLRHRIAASTATDSELGREAERVARGLAASGAWFAAAAWLDAAASVSDSGADRDRCCETATMMRVYGGARWPPPPAAAADGDESAYRLASIGASLVVASQLVEGEAVLRQAWAKVDPVRDRDLAVRIAVRMSDGLNAQLRSREASEWAARAYHLVAAGDAVPGEDPLSDWIFGLTTSGNLEEALATAAREVPPRSSRAVGLLGRGLARVISDDLMGALADARASHDYFKRVGPAHKWLEASLLLVELHYRLGDWNRAIECAASAQALADELDVTLLSGFLMATVAAVIAGQGRFEDASALLREAEAELALKGSYQAAGWLFVARARVAAASGDDHAVVGTLSTLEALVSAFPAGDEQLLLPWRLLLGTAQAHTGQVDAARVHADHLTGYAQRHGVASLAAGAARLRGLVAAADGDTAVARRELVESAEIYAAIPMRLEAAVSEYELGCALARAGDESATRYLSTAAAAFARIGAAPYHERAVQQLESVGSPPAAGDTGPLVLRDLTHSEATVAHLVAAGRSNREVAATLVVSVRTVEHHLGRVYAKLGLTSRTQLAALLAGLPRPVP